MQLLIGNAVMLVSSIFLVLSGLPRKQSTCILLQSCQLAGLSVGNLIFGSIPGLINNLFTLARNYFAHKNKLNWALKVTIILLSSAISIVFNSIGVFVVFPLCSFIVMTLLIDTKNIVVFKSLMIFNCICWIVHDIYIQSYVIVVFNIISIITILISILKETRKD